MDAAQLKDRQRPLKNQYRADPASAVLTLRAEGSLSEDAPACSVQTGRALVEAGLHSATGGDGALACSGDMLLQALVACAGVTLRAIAINRGIEVTGSVSAAGELDFAGTLGVAPDSPVGFRAISLTFDLESSAPEVELDALIDTTRRYCVVLQTLATPTPITVARS